MFGPEIGELVDGVTKLTRLELQSPRTRSRRRTSASSCSRCRRTSACCWSSSPTACTTCARSSHMQRRRSAAHRARDDGDLRAARRAHRHAVAAGRARGSRLPTLNPEAYADRSSRALEHAARAERRPDRRDHPATAAEARRTDGIKADVSGREKTPYSIWRKMQRKNIAFEQLSDIMASASSSHDVADCYRALGVRAYAPGTPCRAASRTTSRPRSRTATSRSTRPSSARATSESRCRSAPSEMHEVAEYRRRRALALQGSTARTARVVPSQRLERLSLAARAARHAARRRQPRGVPRAHQARAVPGPGVLLHAERAS